MRGLVARCFESAGPERGARAPDGGVKASSCAAAGEPSGGAHGSAAAAAADSPADSPAIPWAYAGLDGISVLGAGRVRRIFTLRDAPLREVTPYLPLDAMQTGSCAARACIPSPRRRLVGRGLAPLPLWRC